MEDKIILKSADVAIDNNDPFNNDALNRKYFANNLTTIVQNCPDGFVLALNNEWGGGKTTFLKMWQQSLIIDKFDVIYFNCWENDLHNKPFVAIMAEIESNITRNSEDGINEVIQKAGKIVQNSLPLLFKAIFKQKFGEDFSDFAEKIIEGTLNSFSNEISEYKEQKLNIEKFKKELKKFIENNIVKKPIIFIIDELDRCRPDYAVELLECIKHLFSVEGIVFVLGIDKIQLQHSICGFYGSDKFNSEEYLRRFIDVEVSLPKPTSERYLTFLLDHKNINNNLSKYNVNISEIRSNIHDFIYTLSQLFNLNLRQIDKLVNNINLTFDKYTENVGYLKLLIYLSIMKLIDVSSFDEINKNKENINDLLEINYKYVAKNAKLSNDFLNFLIDVEVLLILAINQDFKRLKIQNDGSTLYKDFSNHEIMNQIIGQSIKSKFDVPSDNNSFRFTFLNYFKHLVSAHILELLSKNKICNKIDMFYNYD